MDSPLPPDPYLALGVAKDAGASAIKTQYRKLVLKFHPDKVKDETQKKAAADEFHKIQTAYEIIGDEDKRQRYDAQVKLSDLRKDVMGRSGSERGTTGYNASRESKSGAEYHARGSDRVSPTYEERRPTYAAPDYFDQAPRPTSRKDKDDPYERSARYQTSREEKPKAATKTSKDSERSTRREKSKRTDKDIKRERDRKPAPARVEIVSDASSSEDEYERAARRREPGARERLEEEQKRVKEQFWAQAARQKEEADRGHYSDERTKKMFSQHAQAFDAIRSGSKRPEQVTRPSPSRTTSSKDNWKTAFAKVRLNADRPELSRRESTRSRPSTRDTEARRPATRDYDRRTSDEFTDEPRDPRKPGLSTAKSSPVDTRIPIEIRSPTEKPRSQSVQMEKDDLPQPTMRRAETMPMQSSSDRERERERDARKVKDAHVPQRSSGLRQTEFPEGMPTPSASPEYAAAAQDPGTYYRYQTQYADDNEYPTPDGFKTNEVRPQGKSKRLARSPSPPREREREVRETRPDSREVREARDSVREKARAASARYAQPSVQAPVMPPRTTSTSYVYNEGRNVDAYTRPAPVRDNSARGDYLYGEMRSDRDLPPTRSPKVSSRYSPPLDADYRPSTATYRTRLPEDTKSKPAYAYSRRPPNEVRPSYTSRTNSNAYPIPTR